MAISKKDIDVQIKQVKKIFEIKGIDYNEWLYQKHQEEIQSGFEVLIERIETLESKNKIGNKQEKKEEDNISHNNNNVNRQENRQ